MDVTIRKLTRDGEVLALYALAAVLLIVPQHLFDQIVERAQSPLVVTLIGAAAATRAAVRVAAAKATGEVRVAAIHEEPLLAERMAQPLLVVDEPASVVRAGGNR